MKNTTKRVLAIAGVLALGIGAVKAQADGALLDALVKKGVLSDQEAEDIRASAASDYSKTPAGKLGISDYVQKLTLYGDARLRFEYLDEKPQNSAVKSGDTIDERNRYRLRVGADYTFTDNFKAGVELESGTANDSANQTMGSAYNKAAINIGLIYLSWKPVDWLTITGGKQRNPLYTTDLVWDPDINPEGASEVANWTFPIDFGGGDSAPVSDPKDAKAISAPAHEPSTMSLSIGLTAFQGIYTDQNEFNAPGTNDTDVWQFVEQVPIQFNFNKDTFIKEVPGFDVYMGGGNAGAGNGPPTTAGGGTNAFTSLEASDDLAIVTAPGEVDWKLWDLPMRGYWDFAANLDGKSRVQNVYLGNGIVPPGAATTPEQLQNRGLGDNIAWLAGLQVGQNKKKGDWSIKADYRQVGVGSIDPNLNDSDWGDSFLNQQGVKAQASYNFTDFLVGSVTYYDSWDYKPNLLNGSTAEVPTALPIVTGASGGTAGVPGLVGASTVQRVQVDLLWKF